jgi:hypothetical protein
LSDPETKTVCKSIQDEYGTFIEMPVVPFGQLFGGKICAALDRQHPRDLFDVKLLLENEGFSDAVREGFLLWILCSDRPINEVLEPNFLDQRQTMEKQFSGMSDVPFTYEEFESTREQLVKTINNSLTDADKTFLLSFKDCDPNWDIHDFERFPGVQWKLLHLSSLKETNPQKHRELYSKLLDKLGT